MTVKEKPFAIIVLFAVLLLSGLAAAEDWPMWRYDAQHTASSPEELPRDLQLQWVLELPPPDPCWPPTQIRLQFDLSYEPIVTGDLVIVPSMVRDSVTAYDIETGEKKWRYYAEGPVRFAPVAWEDKVYFVSDDGYLYCLDAVTGSLLWKFLGGPSDSKLLGNERLISMWPARGAPVVYEGKIYFAASIWPFMGIFIHALDAATGEVVWTNSGSGSELLLQPHSSPAFAGVAPQGYLAATDDMLLVPGGRSVPAGYDRRTGEFLYFETDTDLGGYDVFIGERWFFNDGRMYNLSNGYWVPNDFPGVSVISGDAMIGADGKDGVLAASLDNVWPAGSKYYDDEEELLKTPEQKVLWKFKGSQTVGRVFMKAGSRVYTGRKDGFIAAIAMPPMISRMQPTSSADEQVRLSWRTRIIGTPWSMLAANGKLLVVTEEGRIYCFGAPVGDPATHVQRDTEESTVDEMWARRASRLLDLTGANEGYCLILGVGTGQLLEAVSRQSDFHIIGLDPDPAKIQALRRKLDEAGLYGERIALLTGDMLSLPLPPYLASLVLSEDLEAMVPGRDGAFAGHVFRVLRPYGGVAAFDLTAEARDAFVRLAAEQIPGARLKTDGDLLLIERPGPLPGAAQWTHQYGDVGNTVFSKDKVVKPPLGLLWFGGPSHEDVLPRHAHGPTELVIGGRLFIEGIGVISARDVYTGRLLWRRELPQLDTFGGYHDESFDPDPYDRSYNQEHIPGANAYGSNLAATLDELYIVQGSTCLVLDAATGVTRRELKLPVSMRGERRNWGYIGIWQDLVIAGAAPLHISEEGGRIEIKPNARFGVGSQHLLVMDRHSGNVLWEREANYNFRHNTIVAGSGKLFFIDGMSPARMDMMKRRGIECQAGARLLALDIRSGRLVWSVDENVFGTWLGYSDEYDVLLQAGSRAGDRAEDEVGSGMGAYRGSDGTLLWRSNREYKGPCILWHDKIITQLSPRERESHPAKAFSLLTGDLVERTNPLTGEATPWEWFRFYGCNTAIGSDHLLTFRSASAAYMDLATGLGPTSIGGFKSGCTSNLVVADGVLNAPDYTRTCICSYQNQTSLALVHMRPDDPWSADIEGWSLSYLRPPEQPTPVTRLGINLGAPGTRTADDGTLWLNFPRVDAIRPDVPIYLEAHDPKLFRYHMSRLEKGSNEKTNGALEWVAASGIEGLTSITIRPFVQPKLPVEDDTISALAENASTNRPSGRRNAPAGSYDSPRPYTVRLHFAELEDLEPGDRVFDVLIQGSEALQAFDIVKAAGSTNRAVVVEFRNIQVKDDLLITMKQSRSDPPHRPLLCGIELLAETL